MRLPKGCGREKRKLHPAQRPGRPRCGHVHGRRDQGDDHPAGLWLLRRRTRTHRRHGLRRRAEIIRLRRIDLPADVEGRRGSQGRQHRSFRFEPAGEYVDGPGCPAPRRADRRRGLPEVQRRRPGRRQKRPVRRRRRNRHDQVGWRNSNVPRGHPYGNGQMRRRRQSRGMDRLEQQRHVRFTGKERRSPLHGGRGETDLDSAE